MSSFGPHLRMPCLGAGQTCGASLSSGEVDALLDRDLNPSPRSTDMLRRDSSNPGELLRILGGPAALAGRADVSSRRICERALELRSRLVPLSPRTVWSSVSAPAVNAVDQTTFCRRG